MKIENFLRIRIRFLAFCPIWCSAMNGQWFVDYVSCIPSVDWSSTTLLGKCNLNFFLRLTHQIRWQKQSISSSWDVIYIIQCYNNKCNSKNKIYFVYYGTYILCNQQLVILNRSIFNFLERVSWNHLQAFVIE